MKVEITEADRAEAQRLIAAGYYQTSRRYRMLARLPPGMTGREALRAAGWSEADVGHLGEAHCGDQYLRVYAADNDKVMVTVEVFEAFRQLGGDTYLNKHGAYEPLTVIGECLRLLGDLRATCPTDLRSRLDAAVAHARTCLAHNVRRDAAPGRPRVLTMADCTCPDGGAKMWNFHEDACPLLDPNTVSSGRDRSPVRPEGAR